MHELSVTKHILDYCVETAKKEGASHVRTIRLLLGPYSGIVPECIQLYFDVLSQDTIAQGAKIKVTEVPLRVLCRDCGRESEITRLKIQCPYCKSLKLKRLSGKEFIIESLEVD